MQKFVGLDVHRSFIYAVVMDKEGNILLSRKYKSEPNQINKLLKELDPKETTIAIEACSVWQYIYDYLFDSGYYNLVLANPLQVKIIANSRKKTDKNDATALADLLRTNMLPESYAAPRDIREQRQITRHRSSLTRLRTQLKNKVHAILMRHDIKTEYSDIFGERSIQYLRSIDLPMNERVELDNFLDIVENINSKISDTNELVADYVNQHPHARLLMTVKGIDFYSALTICGEIGDIHRFRSRKQLRSFAGLNPSVYQSGNTVRMGKISKQGNINLRWILGQCANVAIRNDSYFAKYYHSLKKRGKHHNVAVTATARKMLDIIYTMMKYNLPYHVLQSVKSCKLQDSGKKVS